MTNTAGSLAGAAITVGLLGVTLGVTGRVIGDTKKQLGLKKKLKQRPIRFSKVKII